MASSSTHNQQPQWPRHDVKQRIFAASLALLITLFLSMQFKHGTNKISDTEFNNRPFTLLILQKDLAERQKKLIHQVPIKISLTNKLKFVPSTVKQVKKMTVSPPIIRPNTTPVQAIEQTSEQVNEQSIKLLPINNKTIAKAYADSKSEIQKMAEASGKELNTPIATKYDRFQTAAEQALIPDCLSPQGPGGLGLIAIPVIALAAATGKCK